MTYRSLGPVRFPLSAHLQRAHRLWRELGARTPAFSVCHCSCGLGLTSLTGWDATIEWPGPSASRVSGTAARACRCKDPI